MLLQHVLPHARRDNLHLFKTSTLLEADVQAALEEARSDLHTLYEKVKGGRPRLMLAEWQKLLQKQLLFGEFSISQHTCRLTQSQSKANFIASAADPVAGHSEEATRALTLTPDPSPHPNPSPEPLPGKPHPNRSPGPRTRTRHHNLPS